MSALGTFCTIHIILQLIFVYNYRSPPKRFSYETWLHKCFIFFSFFSNFKLQINLFSCQRSPSPLTAVHKDGHRSEFYDLLILPFILFSFASFSSPRYHYVQHVDVFYERITLFCRQQRLLQGGVATWPREKYTEIDLDYGTKLRQVSTDHDFVVL